MWFIAILFYLVKSYSYRAVIVPDTHSKIARGLPEMHFDTSIFIFQQTCDLTKELRTLKRSRVFREKVD